MKEFPLRQHALQIKRIREGNTVKFQYQHSPVFDDLRDCVKWIKDHLGELQDAS